MLSKPLTGTSVDEKDQKLFIPNKHKENSPQTIRIKLVSINDFFSMRSPKSINKTGINQKYSHIREFTQDSNNFYRVIGISLFEQLLKEDSTRRLQDYIDSILSKKIAFKSWIYPYNIEELRTVLCGYLHQLVKLKNSTENSIKIRHILYEMANQDAQFDASIISLIKETILQYLGDISMNLLKTIIPSINESNITDFIKKIYNNDFTLIEEILTICSVIFSLNINSYLYSDQYFTEKTYTNPKLNSLNQSKVNINIIYDKDILANGIHILISKDEGLLLDTTNSKEIQIPQDSNWKLENQFSIQKIGLPPKNETSKQLKNLNKLIKNIQSDGSQSKTSINSHNVNNVPKPTSIPIHQNPNNSQNNSISDNSFSNVSVRNNKTLELTKPKKNQMKNPRFLTPSRANENRNFFNDKGAKTKSQNNLLKSLTKPISNSFLDTSEVNWESSENYELSNKKESKNYQNPDVKMSKFFHIKFYTNL